MITLHEYLMEIGGTNHTPGLDPREIVLKGGYVCDMLSDVMGSAREGQVWITIMKHLNTIAVASMTGVPAIILSKGNVPEQAVIDKANEEGICICSSELDTFSLAGILYTLLQK